MAGTRSSITFRELASSNSTISSARYLNIIGGLTAAILIAFDTFYNKKLDTGALTTFLAYCAGQYATSKYMATQSTNKSQNNTGDTDDTASIKLPS